MSINIACQHIVQYYTITFYCFIPLSLHIFHSISKSQTLYHVYVIDCEAQPTKWLQWQPSRTPEHTGEIDPTAGELLLHGILFPAVLGFCWVDFQTLIEECMSISTNVSYMYFYCNMD